MSFCAHYEQYGADALAWPGQGKNLKSYFSLSTLFSFFSAPKPPDPRNLAHHLIQMLRHESNSGHLDDLSHIASEYCLADPLTKSTAKPDQLVSSITTGKLENVDTHPPFRSLLKHKAFLTTWVIETLSEPHNVLTFFCEDISDYVFAMMYFEE